MIEAFVIYADDFPDGRREVASLEEAREIAKDLWEPSSIWLFEDGVRKRMVEEFEGIRALIQSGRPYKP